MTFSAKMEIGAHFKAIVRDGKTHKIKTETPWIKNLVLDSGLNRMGQGTWLDRCCVGTGTVEPVVTDIGLTNFLAASTNRIGWSTGRATTGTDYYRFYRTTWRFNIGQAQGTVSEVGLGWNNANLWNKVLLKDVNGDPSPITVLADDYLDIIAEIRHFIVIPNPTGTINLLNKDNSIKSTHNYTLTPFFGSGLTYDYNIWGGALLVEMTSYSGAVKSQIDPPDNYFYSSSNRFSTLTTLRTMLCAPLMDVSEGNGSHKTLTFSVNAPFWTNSFYYQFGFQVQLDPPIVKDNTQRMKHQAIISWDRVST